MKGDYYRYLAEVALGDAKGGESFFFLVLRDFYFISDIYVFLPSTTEL